MYIPIFTEVPDEEFIVTCLLMVFVAVSIPKLARHDNTVSVYLVYNR